VALWVVRGFGRCAERHSLQAEGPQSLRGRMRWGSLDVPGSRC